MINQKSKKRIARKKIISKSITVSIPVYKALSSLKNELLKNIGGKITFNTVIQKLFNDSTDLRNSKTEVENIKREVNETRDFIKNMLELSIKSQPKLIPIQSSPLQYDNNKPLTPPPPMKITLSKEEQERIKEKLNEIETKTDEIKKQYAMEITAIFKGDILPPTEIIKITNPSYKDSEVKKIEEDKIPSIFEKSFVMKNKDKFKSSDQERILKEEI